MSQHCSPQNRPGGLVQGTKEAHTRFIFVTRVKATIIKYLSLSSSSLSLSLSLSAPLHPIDHLKKKIE